MARNKEKDTTIRATLQFEKDAGLKEVRSTALKLARSQLAHAVYLLRLPRENTRALHFRAGPVRELRGHRTIVIRFRGRLDGRAFHGVLKLRISPASDLSGLEMQISPPGDWPLESHHAFRARLIKEIKLWDDSEPAIRMRIRGTRSSLFHLPARDFFLPWMFHCSGGPDIESESLRSMRFSVLQPVARSILSPRGLRHFCILLQMASKAAGRPFLWSADLHMAHLAPEGRFDPLFRQNQVQRRFAIRLVRYLGEAFHIKFRDATLLNGEPILREVEPNHFVFHEKVGLLKSSPPRISTQAAIALDPKNHRLALLILLHLGLNGNTLECDERELLIRFGHGRAEHAGRSLRLLMRELAFLSKHEIIKYEKTTEAGRLRIESLIAAAAPESSGVEKQQAPDLKLRPELRMLMQLTGDDWNCIVNEIGYPKLGAMTELQPRLLRQITRTGRVPQSFYRAVRNNEDLSNEILAALKKHGNA